MNRDEARSRGPELAPAVQMAPIPWIAPRDSQRGGTWIGVNARGVVALLLNGYLPGDTLPRPEPVDIRSRGEIVPRLMTEGSTGAMADLLERRIDPAPFPSFTIVIADWGAVNAWSWTGSGGLVRSQHDAEWSFFTSSSWNTGEVTAWREHAFQAWRNDGAQMDGTLPALHVLQPSGLAEWSPLMDRERTSTRSITQVELAREHGSVIMRYWPRAAIDGDREPQEFYLPLLREHAVHG